MFPAGFFACCCCSYVFLLPLHIMAPLPTWTPCLADHSGCHRRGHTTSGSSQEEGTRCPRRINVLLPRDAWCYCCSTFSCVLLGAEQMPCPPLRPGLGMDRPRAAVRTGYGSSKVPPIGKVVDAAAAASLAAPPSSFKRVLGPPLKTLTPSLQQLVSAATPTLMPSRPSCTCETIKTFE